MNDATKNDPIIVTANCGCSVEFIPDPEASQVAINRGIEQTKLDACDNCASWCKSCGLRDDGFQQFPKADQICCCNDEAPPSEELKTLHRELNELKEARGAMEAMKDRPDSWPTIWKAIEQALYDKNRQIDAATTEDPKEKTRDEIRRVLLEETQRLWEETAEKFRALPDDIRPCPQRSLREAQADGTVQQIHRDAVFYDHRLQTLQCIATATGQRIDGVHISLPWEY